MANAKTRTKTAEGVARALKRAGGGHLGDIVFLETTVEDQLINRDMLRDALRSHGVDDSVVTKMSSQAALSRAYYSTEPPYPKRFAFRRKDKRSREVAIDEIIGEDLNHKRQTVALLVADDTAGVVARYRDTAPPQELLDTVEALRQEFRRRLEYLDGTEVGVFVRRYIHEMKCARMMLRGSLYWAPAEAGNALRALSAAMSDAGVCHVSYVPVYDTPEARKNVSRGVAKGFAADIDALRTRLGRLSARNDNEDAAEVRASTVSSRIKELDELTVRVDVMANVLDAQRDGLVQQLAEAREYAVKLLTRIVPD